MECLIRIAPERHANFLLAWWNASECGGFDLTDLWSVDFKIAQDMIDVVKLIVSDENTLVRTLARRLVARLERSGWIHFITAPGKARL